MWFGNIKERILYEDEDILVCRKPAGIAVQNARIGSMDLESSLKNYLAAEAQKRVSAGNSRDFTSPYLAVIHRLDQPVEGILVFGKNQKAAAQLTAQLTAGQTEKYYLAVTDRKPSENSAVLKDYLKKDGRTNCSAVVSERTPGAKQAVLSYAVLETKECVLLRIRLETGRHHQIRVQMAHAGMPLLGDRKYGGTQAETLALCSAQLSFLHPSSKKRMNFCVTPEGRAFEAFDCLKKQCE